MFGRMDFLRSYFWYFLFLSLLLGFRMSSCIFFNKFVDRDNPYVGQYSKIFNRTYNFIWCRKPARNIYILTIYKMSQTPFNLITPKSEFAITTIDPSVPEMSAQGKHINILTQRELIFPILDTFPQEPDTGVGRKRKRTEAADRPEVT